MIDNPAARMKLLLVQTAAETDGELLEMEAMYEPGSVEPPEHFHPKQDERFEILAGTMEARIGGDFRSNGRSSRNGRVRPGDGESDAGP